MSRRSCVNSSDKFCYICGKYTFEKQRLNITDFVKTAYSKYFGREIESRDKTWVPHKVCQSCTRFSSLWDTGKIKHLPFSVPMIWREPSSHDVCYFCCCKISGFNSKNKKAIVYPDVSSVSKPVPFLPKDILPVTPRVEEENFTEEELPDYENNDINLEDDDGNPKLLNQSSLNDLVRELDLPKDKAELLGSRLAERNFLKPEVTFCWYRNREEKFSKFFSDKDSMSYCNNVQGLIEKFGIQYDVLLPSLHLKLGFMKQYVKALKKDGECFLYLKKSFRL